MNPPTLNDYLCTLNNENQNYQAAMRTFFTNLYQDNIDINITDSSGMTLLHHLASKKEMCHELEIIFYDILRHKADVNLLDNNGWTPLHLAVMNDRFRLVELLIHFKADLSIKDNNGDTPLHLSSKAGAGGVKKDPSDNRPGHLTTLATLLTASYNQNPSIIEIRNNQKKRFNDLFSKTIQVQIFNRFKALKNIKTSRIESDQVDSILRSNNKNIDTLCALISLNDHLDTIKRFEKDMLRSLNLFSIPLLFISHPIIKLLKLHSELDSKSATNRFLHFYSHSKSLKLDSDLFVESTNSFSIFNRMCSLYDSKEMDETIKNSSQASLIYHHPNLICSNAESLITFHPELAEKYLPYVTFKVRDIEKFQETCPICKYNVNIIGDKWIKLKCRHQFHEDCLFQWLSLQKTCPMCRRALHFLHKIDSF